MRNFRLYGNKPYKIAVIHGGPGAPGEMAPVARELSSDYGVIEPLQTAQGFGFAIVGLQVARFHGHRLVVSAEHLFGVLGMLLVVPFMGFLKVVMEESIETYRRYRFD